MTQNTPSTTNAYPDTQMKQLGMDMVQCIANCTEAHNACVVTYQYCLKQGGKHAEAQHLRLMLDCADITRVSADFMLRNSDLHGYTCALCAQICGQTAQDCSRFGDDGQMNSCATILQRCADSCSEMAKNAGVLNPNNTQLPYQRSQP